MLKHVRTQIFQPTYRSDISGTLIKIKKKLQELNMIHFFRKEDHIKFPYLSSKSPSSRFKFWGIILMLSVFSIGLSHQAVYAKKKSKSSWGSKIKRGQKKASKWFKNKKSLFSADASVFFHDYSVWFAEDDLNNWRAVYAQPYYNTSHAFFYKTQFSLNTKVSRLEVSFANRVTEVPLSDQGSIIEAKVTFPFVKKLSLEYQRYRYGNGTVDLEKHNDEVLESTPFQTSQDLYKIAYQFSQTGKGKGKKNGLLVSTYLAYRDYAAPRQPYLVRTTDVIEDPPSFEELYGNTDGYDNTDGYGYDDDQFDDDLDSESTEDQRGKKSKKYFDLYRDRLHWIAVNTYRLGFQFDSKAKKTGFFGGGYFGFGIGSYSLQKLDTRQEVDQSLAWDLHGGFRFGYQYSFNRHFAFKVHYQADLQNFYMSQSDAQTQLIEDQGRTDSDEYGVDLAGMDVMQYLGIGLVFRR